MLNYEFPPLGGGAANANYYLLKELSKKDVEIDLITSSSNKFKKEQFSKNIRIFKLNVGKKNVHFWKMTEILSWTRKSYSLAKKMDRKYNYDLVHCWFGWPSGVIGYLLKKPYIVALRGSDVPGYNPRLKTLDKILFRPISRKVWAKAKKVIANSEGLKKLALKTYRRKIDIIYNGIDIKEFNPKQTKNKKLKIISTGRLIERKGYQFLIPALSGIDCELILIGGGNLKEELQNLAKKHKVKTTFKGAMDHKDISKELPKADLFVLPSLNEGMSNSILEAMACGLPIITTDVGGAKELVKDNGFVVKKASVSALRNVFSGIDKKKLTKMGKESRKLAENMSWQSVAKEYWRVYDELA
jgi:glycosyltransferase involved in cell wall biosynthesis